MLPCWSWRSREQGLFAAHPDDLEVRGRLQGATRGGAEGRWTGSTSNRSSATWPANCSARPEHDTPRLRPDGLPAIDWVEVPEIDARAGASLFIKRTNGAPSRPSDGVIPSPMRSFKRLSTPKMAMGTRLVGGAERWRCAQRRESRHFVTGTTRENVDWYAAVALCRWLTWQAQEKRDLLPSVLRRRSDWRISLPTEWQWEKAAAARWTAVSLGRRRVPQRLRKYRRDVRCRRAQAQRKVLAEVERCWYVPAGHFAIRYLRFERQRLGVVLERIR